MKLLDIYYRKDPRSKQNRVVTLRLESFCPSAILVAFFLFLCSWHKIYFSSEYIAGWDLPGQVAAIERLMLQLPYLRVSSYDPNWFGGWGLDLFYAPLFHVVTAIFAYPLLLFDKYPAQTACHLGLGLGCAALPFSMWYFLLPFAKSMKRGKELSVTESSLLALAACFLTFWFLNNDNENNNVGYGVVMGIGLYTQLWGWHLMLLHGGALCRWLETKRRKYEVLTIVLFAALFLTHSLTAVFVLGLVFMLTLWYHNDFVKVWRAHIIAIAITGVWLVPAIALSKTYAVVAIVKSSGDMLQVMFRYPVHLLLVHLKACLAGKGGPVDLGFLLILVLFAMLISVRTIRRSQSTVAFSLVVMLAFIFTSSAFLAKCFDLTIHYYRFLGDEVLYLSALLTLAPYSVLLSFSQRGNQFYKRAAGVLMALVLLAGVYSTTCFPQLERQKIIDLYGKTPANQDEVLAYFKKIPQKGRVFFEMFDDDSKYGSWAAHYLESRCYRETGFEAANGLFLESANSYRLIGTTINNLGGHSWATALFFNGDSNKSVEQALRQLKEFGITHVVCGMDSPMYQKLEKFCVSPVVKIGPYVICPISENTWKIAKTDKKKTLIGYVDKAGNLPFEMLQLYFYTRDALGSKYEVIDCTKRELPPEIPVVLVNTADDRTSPLNISRYSDNEKSDEVSAKIERLNYIRHDVIDHYHVWYQESPELDTFTTVVDCFDKFKLAERLAVLTKGLPARVTPNEKVKVFMEPQMEWSKDFQSMELTDLEPNVLFKLNYSYLPYWHSMDARVFKGTNEQIYILPRKDKVRLVYDQLLSPEFWLGIMVSLSGLFGLFIVSRCYGALWLFDRLPASIRRRWGRQL